MPYNLLLLPLLGGFILLQQWHATRFRLARQEKERLLIWAALAGLLLLAAATVLLVGFQRVWPPGATWAATVWHARVPFPHSGKATLALLLGLALPMALNRTPVLFGRFARRRDVWRGLRGLGYDEDGWARVAIRDYGNELEDLLVRSLDRRAPVMLTLGSGKVYVGFVTRSLNPDVERRFVRLLPSLSGYRSKEDHQLSFTTFYDIVHEQAQNPASDLYGLSEQDFEIVIPMGEIKTLSLFDIRAFRVFNEADGGRGAPAPREARWWPWRRRR